MNLLTLLGYKVLWLPATQMVISWFLYLASTMQCLYSATLDFQPEMYCFCFLLTFLIFTLAFLHSQCNLDILYRYYFKYNAKMIKLACFSR